MSRHTIVIPDDLEPHVKAAADGNLSAWLTKVARDTLHRQAAEAVAHYERTHADAAWDDERERTA